MASATPLKLSAGETQQFQSGDFVPVASGGTGVTTFGGVNTILYTTASGVLASTTNLVYDGTSGNNNLSLLANFNNALVFFGQNSSAGAAATTQFQFRNNNSKNLNFGITSNGFTATSRYPQDGVFFENTGTGATAFTASNAAGIMTFLTGGTTERWRMDVSGNWTNTGGAGTAQIHLKAGSASANSAPLQFTAGTNETTPRAGVMEYDGTSLFFTNSTAVRGRANVLRAITSAAATLTLTATYSCYSFTGTTTTWTLPVITGNTNVCFFIKNRGSGILTLVSAAAGNDIYGTTAVASFSINPGEAYIVINDGTYYTMQ